MRCTSGEALSGKDSEEREETNQQEDGASVFEVQREMLFAFGWGESH